jgi:hypothetical protein
VIADEVENANDNENENNNNNAAAAVENENENDEENVIAPVADQAQIVSDAEDSNDEEDDEEHDNQPVKTVSEDVTRNEQTIRREGRRTGTEAKTTKKQQLALSRQRICTHHDGRNCADTTLGQEGPAGFWQSRSRCSG